MAAVCLMGLIFIGYLALEAILTRRARNKLQYVIHVNGTRGKTAVCRLITAALRAGGYRVAMKSTGTTPAWIAPTGAESAIARRGSPNIREQAWAVRRAAKEGAQVLVVECMAVTPAYQRMSEGMLNADIAVITNVRPDHFEQMGYTLPDIARSLCAMLPRGKTLITAEEAQLGVLRAAAEKMETRVIVASADEKGMANVDFLDNEAIALCVCDALGVTHDTAVAGMRTGYQKDAFAQQSFDVMGHVFISAFSANDPLSTALALKKCRAEYADCVLILLISNRADRPERARQLTRFALDNAAEAVWFYGAYAENAVRALKKAGVNAQVHAAKDFERDVAALKMRALLFGMGNLKGEGMALIASARGMDEKEREA